MKMKYKRVVLSKKDNFGKVEQVTIDFGWIDQEDVQPSIKKIRDAYPGWSLIRCHAIKEEQAWK